MFYAEIRNQVVVVVEHATSYTMEAPEMSIVTTLYTLNKHMGYFMTQINLAH